MILATMSQTQSTRHVSRSKSIKGMNMNLNHVNYKQYENISQYINHPFGLSNFSLQASITQAEKLVLSPCLFSFSTCLSMDSINSCGNRIPFIEDLLFLLPVAIVIPFLNCLYTLTEKRDKKKIDVFTHLDLLLAIVFTHLISKRPSMVATLTGVLITTSLKRSKTMTNSNYTKPTFIFVAVRRADVNSKPQRLKITANTELEARAKLAKEFVLVFAGRINPQNTPKTNRTLEVIYA